MTPRREQVIAALFDLVRSAADLDSGRPIFVTASRRLKLWNEVSRGARPALFVVQHGETHEQHGQGLPPVRTLDAKFYIYFNADQGTVPDATINQVVDAIDAVTGGVLAPDDVIHNTQTLGGLVEHCWIEGEIFKDPGDLDGDGMIVIPVKILIP